MSMLICMLARIANLYKAGDESRVEQGKTKAVDDRYNASNIYTFVSSMCLSFGYQIWQLSTVQFADIKSRTFQLATKTPFNKNYSVTKSDCEGSHVSIYFLYGFHMSWLEYDVNRQFLHMVHVYTLYLGDIRVR